MKHTTYFGQFLKDEVNINQGRLDKLATRVDSVYAALRADDDIGHLVKGRIPQGSWPHRTIIRPRTGEEFDADFLLHLDVNPDWDGNPKKYSDAVYSALDNHPTYGEMDHGRRTRCVYVEYSAERDIGCHLDIVPYLHLPDGRTVIVNRKLNTFEGTDPSGFTTWIQERDGITGGNFRKAVRLMKFYKARGDSKVPSVILTTLLGERVSAFDAAVDPTIYGDLPTTLVNLVSSLDEWLQANSFKPSVPNPGGDGTTFDHRWDDGTYSRFRDRIHTCAGQMATALEAKDPQESMKLWQEVFGESFKPVTDSTSSNSTKFGPTGAGSGSVASRSGKSG